VNFIPMPPKLTMLKEGEATIAGLRSMKCFLKLKSRARRKELIALAEQMVEEESKYPAGANDAGQPAPAPPFNASRHASKLSTNNPESIVKRS
jgi:hypothetical protein